MADPGSVETEPAEQTAAPDTETTPAENATAPRRETAAHCLYVGPEQRVVRCHWKSEDCQGQIDFSKRLGMTQAQECRPVPEAHCLVSSDKTELCYPTANDCDVMVANMRKRKRQTSDCTVKTAP